MSDSLIFDDSRYTVETVEMEGQALTYRAFENIPYVEHPADPKMQRLSIFVPESYYEGKTIGPYDLKSAPIFMPNTVGGYMPGPQERPGRDFMGKVNASFYALLHGYVVVSPGVRGREMKDENGKFIGMAPAMLCDLKAAVRYLRHNADRIPGDAEKIISNGTSAGGAASSLLGATGNHPDYEPCLEEMGAAKERDNIFAASCYCPITNLDHADMAYEWEFAGIMDYHGTRVEPPAPGETAPRITPIDGEMSEEQKGWSEELGKMFPDYVNSLDLRDEKGQKLTLDPDGNGSFKDYVASVVAESVQKEIDINRARKENAAADKENGEKQCGKKPQHPGMPPYADPMEQEWLTVKDGKVTDVDFAAYVRFRTRMKQTPAFDNTSLGTPENELFGNAEIQFRHFTEFSASHSKAGGEMAEEKQIRMMNPMYYIGDDDAVKAEHYRIRHGSVDRDTSLAISAMLALKLKDQGVDTDFAYPWRLPHAGDYDLNELFAWIDGICAK